MLRQLRVWLRRINEARPDRMDASFKGQLARAKRKQSDLKRLAEEGKKLQRQVAKEFKNEGRRGAP